MSKPASWLALFFILFSFPLSAFDLKGNFIEGGWVIGHTRPGGRLLLGSEPVKVGRDGLFLLGFPREAPSLVQLTELFPDGTWRPHFFSIAQRRYARQYLNNLPAQFVTPDSDALTRIQDDQNKVRAARDFFTDARDFLHPFQWPVMGPITGIYGSARILNGEERQPHYGIDIAAPEGTPIQAPAGGIIRLADPGLYLTGGTIILDHGFGFSSTFLHLSKLSVELGQRIEQGDLLGHVGKTGRATGAHLDWRLNWGQIRLDPQFAVPAMTEPEGGWGYIPPSATD